MAWIENPISCFNGGDGIGSHQNSQIFLSGEVVLNDNLDDGLSMHDFSRCEGDLTSFSAQRNYSRGVVNVRNGISRLRCSEDRPGIITGNGLNATSDDSQNVSSENAGTLVHLENFRIYAPAGPDPNVTARDSGHVALVGCFDAATGKSLAQITPHNAPGTGTTTYAGKASAKIEAIKAVWSRP
jgi:hypothetical protein